MMNSIKIIMTFSMLVFPLFANALERGKPKPSVMKSAVLPGWGEHSFESRSRGYLFNGVEAALWVFAGVAYTNAISHENDLYQFAAEYGQISDPHLKSDIYLDRVSKYENMDEYNEQMLRNRAWDRVYSAEDGYNWSWESTDMREKYFNIKTDRYLWRQRLTYAFGAIALNHLVSTMDALYLKRQNSSLSIQPTIIDNEAGLKLSLSF